MSLSKDQVLMLSVAVCGPPQLRREFAEKYARVPSMTGLARDALVQIRDGAIVATDRGHALLKAMGNLPLPVRVSEWRMPKPEGSSEC
jgi:hypothetical protein